MFCRPGDRENCQIAKTTSSQYTIGLQLTCASPIVSLSILYLWCLAYYCQVCSDAAVSQFQKQARKRQKHKKKCITQSMFISRKQCHPRPQLRPGDAGQAAHSRLASCPGETSHFTNYPGILYAFEKLPLRPVCCHGSRATSSNPTWSTFNTIFQPGACSRAMASIHTRMSGPTTQ